MAASQLGIAIPNFWFAILLILLFAVKLQWVRAGGFPGWTSDGVGWNGRQGAAAAGARAGGGAGRDPGPHDALGGARRDARGLRAHRAREGPVAPRVLWRHVLRNAFVPVLTVMGLQFANLITGTIVVENVFVLPGLGRLVFQAIANRDLGVVRDVVMLLAAAVIVINFVVDVLYVADRPAPEGGHG